MKIIAVGEDGRALDGHGGQEIAVGERVPVTASVELAGLDPSDVVVEAFHSSVRSDGTLGTGRRVPLELASQQDGRYLYRGAVPAKTSGLHGYAVRVLPRHEDVLVPHELPLVAWEESEE